MTRAHIAIANLQLRMVKHTMVIGWLSHKIINVSSVNDTIDDAKQAYKEKLLPMLLLERISWQGIARVLQQSLIWIY